MTRKILVHQCCAVCSFSFFGRIPAGLEPSGFWFNPNIEPIAENELRKESVLRFNSAAGVGTFFSSREIAPRVPAAPRPARCRECYITRIGETARFAASSGFDAFTTTILASPYQEHSLAVEIGLAFAEKYRLDFESVDTRDIYYEGKNRAVANGYYSQKYCGCAQSAEERALPKNKKTAAARPPNESQDAAEE